MKIKEMKEFYYCNFKNSWILKNKGWARDYLSCNACVRSIIVSLVETSKLQINGVV